MISRRQLRVKTLQTLYSYYKTEGIEVAAAEKQLLKSVEKAYDLYHSIFILLIEIADLAESKIDQARNKRLPSETDLNPNLRFVDSNLIKQLRECDQLIRYAEAHKITWKEHPELIKELFTGITMEQPEVNFSDEVKLISHLLTVVVYPNENLELELEEQNIFWLDDLEYMISMVIKTLKRFREDGSAREPLLPLYKEQEGRKVPEDKEFVIELFRQSIVHRDEYVEMVKSNTRNWDLDRIAFMDILIMQVAIAEFIGFASIPTKVTLNEYLEVAKIYSTNKSNVFINGVLDKVMVQLRESGDIRKTGRGLIGEHEGAQ